MIITRLSVSGEARRLRKVEIKSVSIQANNQAELSKAGAKLAHNAKCYHLGVVTARGEAKSRM